MRRGSRVRGVAQVERRAGTMGAAADSRSGPAAGAAISSRSRPVAATGAPPVSRTHRGTATAMAAGMSEKRKMGP
jgi:hypothetical protein